MWSRELGLVHGGTAGVFATTCQGSCSEGGEVERGEGGAEKDRESVPVLFTTPGRGGGPKELGRLRGIRVIGPR